MGVHSPMPGSLRQECIKAASIIKDFTMPSASSGPDSLIPKNVFLKCRGIAVISVLKVGFLVTLRAGFGLVVGRKRDGTWTAPSAVGLGGIGGGFELGGEMTDFVIILNSDGALASFMKGGNVTLGGNLTVALGPLGRNVESDVSLRNAAAFYTYSKSRGLFAGISLEGSSFVERKATNRKLYGGDVRARDILSGRIDPPKEAEVLYSALQNASEGAETSSMASMARSVPSSSANWGGNEDMPIKPRRFSLTRKKDTGGGPTVAKGGNTGAMAVRMAAGAAGPPGSGMLAGGLMRAAKTSGGGGGGGGGYGGGGYSGGSSSSSAAKSSGGGGGGGWNSGGGSSSAARPTASSASTATRSTPTSSASSYSSSRSTNYSAPQAHTAAPVRRVAESVVRAKAHEKPAAAATEAADPWDLEVKAKALWTFEGTMDCDLSFKKGDIITILTRTDTQNDWWEGSLNDVVGIFPANFVRVL